MLAWLGDIQFGTASVFEGPTADSETLSNTINEHDVVRGKKPVQSAGAENDRREMSFVFDESFCDVEANEARLRQAAATLSPLSLIMGQTYAGKSYAVQEVTITKRQTTRSGRSVRIEGSLSLIESGGSVFSLPGLATAALAVLNPLLRG